MKNSILKRLSVSALALATALSVLPAVPAAADGLHCVFVTRESDGKLIWFENNVQQGTLEDPQGILGDGTNRGREIYDAATNEWYWLDAFRSDDPAQNLDGAKAVNKEVWIPYVYQQELVQDASGVGRVASGLSDEAKIAELAAGSNLEEADMSAQVADSIRNRTGKWVRYNETGAMIKGWFTVEEGSIWAINRPDQLGNTYYYDWKTGLMAKGWLTINGVQCHFDEISGALDQVITSEEPSQSTYKTLRTMKSEYVYQKARSGQRDHYTVYFYEDAAHPDEETRTEQWSKDDNGDYQLMGESKYEYVTVKDGNSSYSTNRITSEKSWSTSNGTRYLYRESTYTYSANSKTPYNADKQESVYYDVDGKVRDRDIYTYVYDENGRQKEEYCEYVYYDTAGAVTSHSKTKYVYTYDNKGNQIEQVTWALKVDDDDEEDHIESKYVYNYNEETGNRSNYQYYYRQYVGYDETTGESKYDLQLSSYTEYKYEQIDGSWRNTEQLQYKVVDGVKTDELSYKYVYKYENGKQVRYESWRNVNGTLKLSSYSVTTYGENGYDSYYRSYSIDSNDDPYVSYGYDYLYNVTENRTFNWRDVYYSGEKEDGSLEINYYVDFEDFSRNTSNWPVGEQRTKTNKYYNGDGSAYYTYATTYECIEVTR